MDTTESPLLAQLPVPCCTSGVQQAGNPNGTLETIAGIQTYVATPPAGVNPVGVILFYSDVWSPLFVNNQLIMDWFAGEGE